MNELLSQEKKTKRNFYMLLDKQECKFFPYQINGFMFLFEFGFILKFRGFCQ
jgi:hypothetical protein